MRLALLGLAIANIFIFHAIFAERATSVTKIGDSTLIRGHGATILVGVGKDASILRALGSALPFYIKKIDVVVLTDAKAGGMPFIRQRYKIGAVAHKGDRILVHGTELSY